MKTINNYISEKLKISNNTYSLFPKSKDELVEIIKKEIEENGNKCDLNHIDVSKITNMNDLFSNFYKLHNFNGDISEWDVSNVKEMGSMFENSNFNGDIYEWNTSNVTNMSWMFTKSKFNNNSICNWDVSNVTSMRNMFYKCPFNYPLNKWNVSNVRSMYCMFNNNKYFNQDISMWKINPDCNTEHMFLDSCIKHDYRPLKNGKRIY
jgi:hypothetical protein